MKWQNHIGLDIGSTSIKVAQLEFLGDEKFKLVALGRAEGDGTSPELIKKLVKDAHVTGRSAAISLAESQVYTRVIEIPFLEEPELSGAISWQAEQYIPVPLSEVVLKHQVLALPEQGVPGAKMSVLLVAAPTSVIANYSAVVSAAGLEVVAVETEILAAVRALTMGVSLFPQTMLIHIGAETTTFCVFREGILSLSQSIGTGGAAITRSVGNQLGLDGAAAEEYKRSYGLDETKLDGKVAAAIRPVADFILAEGKKVVAAYESRTSLEKEPVRQVILSGGGSILPGIVSYFANGLGLEVQLGNPFHAVATTPNQKLEIGSLESVFSVAVGLAQKPL